MIHYQGTRSRLLIIVTRFGGRGLQAKCLWITTTFGGNHLDDLHGAGHVQGEHHGGGQVQDHGARHGPVQGVERKQLYTLD